MASSSSTASLKWKYDVFLSFRGKDTRKNFVSHFYKALHQKGIYTFKDDEKLERGKSISPELLEAIKSSRFSVIVLSENYAFSSWCLEELVAILECMDAMGQLIVPIFYNVDPSHVRKEQGTFAKAFAKHGKRLTGNMEMVHKWRKALARVATISGWDSRGWDESVLIEQIVNDILKKLDHKSPSDTTGLIGIDNHIRKLRSLLYVGLNDVRIIGIWGMGGIGKTTIARAVYDEIAHNFEACFFLSNVREQSKRHNMVHLQKQLLSGILVAEQMEIDSISVGITCIRKRFQNLSVLIVLDDVDDKEQIDSLAGGHDWFGERTRIIITTRNREVLVGVADELYEERGLNANEALMLFSLHAFKQPNPCEGFVNLSNIVINHNKGNPLALKVLGSFLFGRTEKEWKSAIERFKSIPHVKIFDVLKISYDGLNSEEKDVFLDIACFLKGKRIDHVVQILDSCDYFTEIDIRVLVDRCLIDISDHKIWMHNLVQQMGWEVVRRQSIKEPGKRSRLWLHEDICHVLDTDTGTGRVEGIVLDSPDVKDVRINSSSFSSMHGLKLLVFENVKIECFGDATEDLETLPNALRYICWQAYPFNWLPRGCRLKNIVVLDMPHSHIKQLWTRTLCPVNLKVLNLRFSKHLESLPDLSQANNLESLILKGCTSLLVVHHSVGYLKKLKILDLESCTALQCLPPRICLRSLENFILSRCRKLKNFPEIACEMKCLLELSLDDTSIAELPSSIGSLKSLVLSNLKCCRMIKHLPNGVCNLEYLKTLNLSGCFRLARLPENLGNLKGLETLEAGESSINELPSSICSLENLKTLILSSCLKLKNLPEDLCKLKSLRTLEVGGTAITQVPSSIASLSNLRTLSYAGCKYTRTWSLHFPLCFLQYLHLDNCNLLDITSAVDCIYNLRVLFLSGNNFRSIPESIQHLRSLQYLHLARCKKLRSLPALPPGIKLVDASDCTSLENISHSFDDLTRLECSTWNTGRPIFWLCNCWRLVRQRQKNFVSEAVQNFHLMQIKLQEQHIQQEWRQLSLCFPGEEVPEWFSHCSTGDRVTFELPLDFFTNTYRGLAFCAVAGFKPTRPEFEDLTINCCCIIRTTSQVLKIFPSFFVWKLGGLPISKWAHHIFLGYSPCSRLQFFLHDYMGDWDTESGLKASFQFGSCYACDTVVQLRSCGVCLIDL